MMLPLRSFFGFFRRPRSRFDAWHHIDSERVLRVLVRNLEGMLFRCSIDAERTLHFASEGSRDLTGYSPSELEGSHKISLEALTHLDDREAVRRSIMLAADHGSRYCVEYRIRCRDGVQKWVVERGLCVFDEWGGRVLEGFVEDVTERVRGQLQLAEAELRYRSIFEHSVVGMFQTSEEGRYLAANQALADLYGYVTPQALVDDLSDIADRLYVNPQRRQDFCEQIRKKGVVRDFESEVFRRDGRRLWISENAHAVHGPEGVLLYYEGTVEDISERRQQQAQLAFQATHDPLTGLPNRNLLQERFDQAMLEARCNDERMVLAFIDLDNFKVINDSLGHAAGDRLLVEISNRLRQSVRSVDTVARYGGDEFVLILGNQSDLSLLVQTLDRIQAAIRKPLQLDGHELYVSCSIGAGLYPQDGQDLASLLRHADTAMYHAKGQGKGQYQFYTPQLNAAVHERLELEGRLRRALEVGGELCVEYQPKINVNGQVTGMEALLRWNNPEMGVVPPARFIPVAEETDLISPLTDFVLETACRDAVAWGDFPVAVNLSARQFAGKSLLDRVERALTKTGLPPTRLQLEITEGMLAGEIDRTAATLHALKSLGVRIAVDDFGTGYSSLAYLTRFPIDILKIDQSFVAACDQDGEEAMAIPRSVISLGHSLGLRIVAEGVERQRQMDLLSALGCEEFQGFLIAPSMDVETLRIFMTSRVSAAA